MSHFILSTVEKDITTVYTFRKIETKIVNHVISCQYFTLKIYSQKLNMKMDMHNNRPLENIEGILTKNKHRGDDKTIYIYIFFFLHDKTIFSYHAKQGPGCKKIVYYGMKLIVLQEFHFKIAYIQCDSRLINVHNEKIYHLKKLMFLYRYSKMRYWMKLKSIWQYSVQFYIPIMLFESVSIVRDYRVRVKLSILLVNN